MPMDADVQLIAVCSLDFQQQLMADFLELIALLEFLLNVYQEMGSGLGIGQRTVVTARHGQLQLLHQGTQLVV